MLTPLAAVVLFAALVVPQLPARAVLAQPIDTPTPLPDLVVDGGRMQLSGTHRYRNVFLRRGAQLMVEPYAGSDDSGRIEIHAERIEIDALSKITGSATGYRGRVRASGEGPGGGEGGDKSYDGGGGGGHGGRGGDGVLDGLGSPAAKGGRAYGDACSAAVDRGSAGGAPGVADNPGETGAGAHGGGAVALFAGTIILTGTIEVNGADGIVASNDAAGGGAGGGVLLAADWVTLTGKIDANGGDGGATDDGGGGGAGGRIKVLYRRGTVSNRNLRVNGGKGDGNGYSNNGQAGQICLRVATATPPPTLGPTPTATPTASLTPAPTASATATWTPVPTTTPTATWTPAPTATPTATATSTTTSEPTATPKVVATRVVAYLPLVLVEDCPKADRQPVAVVIVLDTSTSMTESQNGRTKLGAAINAALVAVNTLIQPEDAIGLVTFNAAATVLAPLTSDAAALRQALSLVPTGLGSRLDEGVRLGGELLAGAGAGSRRRLVVLTDGLPNPSSPADARAASEAVRARGIAVDTIGLGDDVDASLLAAMAGDPSRYHAAPGPEDLAGIFVDLALVPPPCGGNARWPRAASSVRSAPGMSLDKAPAGQ